MYAYSRHYMEVSAELHVPAALPWGKSNYYLRVWLMETPSVFFIRKETSSDIPWSVYKMFVKARCKSEVTQFRDTLETYCSALICGVYVCLVPLVASIVDATSK